MTVVFVKRDRHYDATDVCNDSVEYDNENENEYDNENENENEKKY